MKRNRKETLFPTSLFFTFLVVLLLMAGIHTGLLVLMEKLNTDSIVRIVVPILVPILYWSAIAVALTAFTRWRMQKTYDIPMKRLAEATRQVANGDFSVYVPPLHMAENKDYLDAMIEDFNKMVAELGSIETLKTDFFANVSHEIKTPLAVIQSNATLLQQKELSEERRQEYATNIIQATHRLSALITNILKLNKLEKQSIVPKPEPYDLCAQLCECALQFEDRWDKKEIEFEADLEDSAIIAADQSLMELVWTNLLSNAVKFTPQGGRVILRQQTGADGITVSVSDTGCGISKETQNINLLYFGFAVLVGLFVSDDFKSGYAKNLFTVRAKKNDYVISKMLVCFVAGAFMLLAFMAGTVIGGVFSGLPFALGSLTVGNIIMCLLSKLFLIAIFVAIYLTVSVAAKQKTWLCIVGSCAAGMLLFSMIPMVSPLTATMMNVILCLAGGIMFSFGGGAVSTLILNKRDLV